MMLLFCISVAENDDLVRGVAGPELCEEVIVPFVICLHHEGDPLQRCYAVTLNYAQALTGAIENAQDGYVDTILISAANLVQHRVSLPADALLHVTDKDEGEQNDCGGKHSLNVQAGSARHTDGRNDEDRSRAGQSDDTVACVQNQARAEEADSLDDIGGDAALVPVILAGQDSREQREKGAAEA